MRALWLVLPLFVLVTTARAESSKTVRDWSAHCDTSGLCTAVVPGSGGTAMGGQGYRLEIARGPGADEGWTITLVAKRVPQPNAGAPVNLAIAGSPAIEMPVAPLEDGISFGFSDAVSLPATFAAFKSGQSLTVSFDEPNGSASEQFSLSGLVAVLLWIDEQQQRVGNSAQVVPLPVLSAGKMLSEYAAQDFQNEILATSLVAGCQWLGENKDPSVYEVESFDLDGGRMLYVVGCVRGAYQGTSLVFLRDTDGLRVLSFPEYSDELGWSGTQEIGYDSFDPRTRTLHTYVKFRGIGDCGATARYQWTDYGFKLLEYRYRAECASDENGEIPEFPIIYKANNGG